MNIAIRFGRTVKQTVFCRFVTCLTQCVLCACIRCTLYFLFVCVCVCVCVIVFELNKKLNVELMITFLDWINIEYA